MTERIGALARPARVVEPDVPLDAGTTDDAGVEFVVQRSGTWWVIDRRCGHVSSVGIVARDLPAVEAVPAAASDPLTDVIRRIPRGSTYVVVLDGDRPIGAVDVASAAQATVDDLLSSRRQIELLDAVLGNGSPIGWRADVSGSSLMPARFDERGIRVLGVESTRVEWSEVIRANDLPALNAFAARVLRDGAGRVIVRASPSSAPTERWLELHGRRETQGRIVGVLRDVTTEHSASIELVEQNRLASLGRLAAGVAHDFNNILSIIGATSSVMANVAPLPAEMRAHVSIMVGCVSRASRLTRQLLAYSGDQTRHREVLELDSVVRGCAELFARTLPATVGVDMFFCSPAVLVEADRAQLEQVVLNLLTNAGEAMGPHGHLVVRTRVIEEGKVEIAVRDNGHGMTEETRRSIFDPYFTTKRTGTGLGLATVKGIIDQNQWEISVVSAIGQGTEFCVALPVAQSRSIRSPDIGGLGASARRDLGGRTIMLVEDDDLLRRQLRRALEMNGFRVVEASSGGAAIDLAHRLRVPVDIIVASMRLAGPSGSDIAEAIRAIHPCAIAVLAAADESTAETSFRARGAVLISKPYRIDELLDAIARTSWTQDCT